MRTPRSRRLGWFGVDTVYELNGRTVRIVDSSPFETIMAIARGEPVDVPVAAKVCTRGRRPSDARTRA
ncbi:MAG: hypothetical protein H7269_09800 [Cellulomonas sp.]|nr:hypothetical protein [Cellulomonas sp.]